jgi:FdhE protein
MSRVSWDKRIRRAEQLAVEYPASAEILRFYAQIARFQERIYERLKRQPMETLRRECLDADLAELISLIRRTGPAGLADKARGAEESAFFERVLLQPYMECLTVGRPPRSARDPLVPLHELSTASRQADQGVGRGRGGPPHHCPACGDRPLAAVLRGEGEGGKRWLLCSLCSNEWEFRRVLCPNCGEEDKDRLPVYTAETFDYVRVEACDRCHTYIKSIDLTKNGLAIPCVDEIASVPLDLWAEEAGYTKLQRNILLL